MTEDEAKTKVCHKTLSAMGGEDGVPSWTSHQCCIGSACMAWRKDGAKVKDRRGNLVDRDVDGTGQWQDTGFCGLAGNPHPDRSR